MQCGGTNRVAVSNRNTEEIQYSFISRHCILIYTMLELNFWPVFLTVTNPKTEYNHMLVKVREL
jgi:hypothetical protein